MKPQPEAADETEKLVVEQPEVSTDVEVESEDKPETEEVNE